MDDPHLTNNGGEMNQQQGISTVVFTVVVCTIVILIFVAAGYVIISDWKNGIEAYRNKELRDQRDGYKSACEDMYKNFTIQQEWVRQQGLKPPPEVSFIKGCNQPNSIEKDIDNASTK